MLIKIPKTEIGKEIKVKPLSVNECWQGRRFKTKKYLAYEKEVYYKLPPLNLKTGLLRICLDFGLSNTGMDWDNPIKPFLDILQKRYGFNDNRISEAHITKSKVAKGQEYIWFSLCNL